MAQRKKTVKIPGWAKPILRNAEVDGQDVRIAELLHRADYGVINLREAHPAAGSDCPCSRSLASASL
jgi:hypothetical protein